MKNGDVRIQGKKWMKILQQTIHQCFKKIRIRDNNNWKDSDHMKMEERKELMKKINNAGTLAEQYQLEDKLSKVEEEISEAHKKKQTEKIEEHLSAITNTDGRVNVTGAWKLRRKVCQKPLEQLSAKKDKMGNLITHPSELKDIYLEAYTDRLKHREILPELRDLKIMREQLFFQRLQKAKENKSPAWTMEQLDRVLEKLKKGKATDPVGLVNELFMIENIGDNLKESILMLMNIMKDQFNEPEFMELANITSFWKGKGPKNDIDSERGIFILNIVRMNDQRQIDLQ